jgi:hypothetical protein
MPGRAANFVIPDQVRDDEIEPETQASFMPSRAMAAVSLAF